MALNISGATFYFTAATLSVQEAKRQLSYAPYRSAKIGRFPLDSMLLLADDAYLELGV